MQQRAVRDFLRVHNCGNMRGSAGRARGASSPFSAPFPMGAIKANNQTMSDRIKPAAGPIGSKDRKLDGWLNGATGELTQGVKINPSDIVVDVGCGDGALIHFCARQGRRSRSSSAMNPVLLPPRQKSAVRPPGPIAPSCLNATPYPCQTTRVTW